MADTAVKNIDEVQQVVDQNARMAASLSHEIRTPLTAIQGYAEYMRLAELTAEEQSSALGYCHVDVALDDGTFLLVTLAKDNMEFLGYSHETMNWIDSRFSEEVITRDYQQQYGE